MCHLCAHSQYFFFFLIHSSLNNFFSIEVIYSITSGNMERMCVRVYIDAVEKNRRRERRQGLLDFTYSYFYTYKINNKLECTFHYYDVKRTSCCWGQKFTGFYAINTTLEFTFKITNRVLIKALWFLGFNYSVTAQHRICINKVGYLFDNFAKFLLIVVALYYLSLAIWPMYFPSPTPFLPLHNFWYDLSMRNMYRGYGIYKWK